MADLQPGTEGFVVFDHYPTIQQLTLNPPGPHVPVTCALGRGFHQDLYSGYRAPCLILDEEEAQARSQAGLPNELVFPFDGDGRYHLGFVIQDAPGDEIFRVELGGEPLGRVAAVHGDKRPYLYVSRQAHRLGGSRPVRLVAETVQGAYRTEGMLLLAELPETPQVSEPRVRDLDARPAWMLPGRSDYDTPGSGDMLLTWWTDRVSRCQVALRTQEGDLEPLDGGESQAISHRLIVRRLTPGRRYCLRVTGETDRGEPLAAQELECVAGKPAAAGGDDLEAAGEATRRSPRPDGPQESPRIAIRLRRSHDGDAGQPPTDLDWPLTFGVPMAQGVLKNPGQLGLYDERQRAVPAQHQVTARWPDGSVRWLLTDAQAQGGGGAAWLLRPRDDQELQPGSSTGPPQPPAASARVTVAERVDRVRVTTGALRFDIPKQEPGIISQVQIAGEAGDEPLSLYGLDATLVRADGRTYTAVAPDEVTVEARGPLRATVRVVGGYRDERGQRLGSFDCRIHAYAGRPWLRLSWTFEYGGSRGDMTAIRALRLRLASSFQPPYTARLGAEGEPVVVPAGQGRARLVQEHHDAYRMEVEPAQEPAASRAGSRAPGWAELLGDGGSVGVAVADFWQRYPTGLTVDDGGISVALLPRLEPDAYDARRQGDAAHRLYYHVRGGSYHLRQGVSFTQDLLLSFTRPGGAPAAGALAATLANPPVAVLPPAYYEETGAWLWFSDPQGPAGRAYKETADSFAEIFARDRDELEAYGFLNYGDWWGERNINWGNCEYDTARGLLTQFMRSGEPRFLRLGQAAHIHHRDVDTIHRHEDPQRLGAVCAHAIGHTGGYYRQGEIDTAGGTYEPWDTISHTWVEGHLLAYFLTGDRRSLETALTVGRRYAGQQLAGLKFENCRNPGWHLILTSAMYHATLDPFYLNSCRWIVREVLERQTPDGGWRRQLRPGHCHCLPRCTGNAGFMVGVLLYGLYAYYRTTGDQAVPPAMTRAGRYLLDEVWLEKEATFRYTSCRASRRTMRLDFRPAGGLALAYLLGGDPSLAAALRHSARTHLAGEASALKADPDDLSRVGTATKGISVTMWFAPPVLAIMDELITGDGADDRSG